MVFEEAISKALRETNLEQQQLLDEAAAEYFCNLPTQGFPSASDLDAAESRLRLFLRKELLTSAILSKISGQSSFDKKSFESLAFAFDTIVPPVTVQKPAQFLELRASSVALSALLGAVLGLTLLTPFTRLFLGMRDLGIVMGGPLGAFCMVLIVWRVSKSKTLRKILLAALGIASAAEIWRVVKGYTFFSGIRNMLRLRRPSKGLLEPLKRLVLYIAIMFVLAFSKEKPVFEKSSHEQAVRTCIQSWLKMAIPLIVALQYYSIKPEQVSNDRQEILSTLAGHIYALHRAAQKDLPSAADELIQEAKNLGFEGLDGQPQFFPNIEKREDNLVWASSLIDKYEAFGDITEGDTVKVERKPVILGGKVLRRGLVRKNRERD
ncbi:MAG: hypothetical protein JW787_02710 [Sedimentisphaerales bacterium]|nr:hypothetical protein [Sedimentisphaerales bacterium]